MTSAYKEQRKHGIGSGEIAAVAGLSPWKSRLRVWEEKTGQAEPLELDNQNIKRGIFLEPALIEWATDLLNNEIHSIERPPARCVENKEPWFVRDIVLATPDFVCCTDDGPAVGEIKAPGGWSQNDWGESGTGAEGVPEYVLAQNHWQMYAAQCRRGYVCALIDSLLRVYRINFDERFFRGLYGWSRELMDYVESGEQPPPGPTKPDSDWLKGRYKQDNGTVVVDTHEPELREEIVDSYLVARLNRERWEKIETASQNRVRSMLGERNGVIGVWGKISWKTNKPSLSVDWRGVADSVRAITGLDAEVVDRITKEHTTENPGPRVFRVKIEKSFAKNLLGE